MGDVKKGPVLYTVGLAALSSEDTAIAPRDEWFTTEAKALARFREIRDLVSGKARVDLQRVELKPLGWKDLALRALSGERVAKERTVLYFWSDDGE